VRNEYIESKWDVALRDDSGKKRELKPAWFQGIKKDERVIVCLDRQGAVLSQFTEVASNKQTCMPNTEAVSGVVEEVVETRTKKVNVEYGIESYFVEEGKGIQIEQGRNVRGPLKVEVSLRKDGKGIISRLLLEGK
jgi:uncharacterized membrane-anchored protein